LISPKLRKPISGTKENRARTETLMHGKIGKATIRSRIGSLGYSDQEKERSKKEQGE